MGSSEIQLCSWATGQCETEQGGCESEEGDEGEKYGIWRGIRGDEA
jgi:hypothetical protein